MSGTKELAVINAVTQRAVNKNDGTTITIYEADTTLGKMTTTRLDIAQSAMSLVGQTVELEYAVATKPNPHGGVYTNRYLNGVLPAPTGPIQQAQAAQQAGAPDFLQQAAQASVMIPDAPVKTAPDFKDIHIGRQTATKVAAALSPQSPQEFWESVQSLTHYYNTGQLPIAQAQGAPSPDEDIPF